MVSDSKKDIGETILELFRELDARLERLLRDLARAEAELKKSRAMRT